MRILFVEDEPSIAEAVASLLKKQHYSVDLAYDGETGLDYAASGVYDILVLDIMLPKIDGITLLKTLRKQNIRTPIIMLTAKSEVDDKVLGLDAGADDYLTKPFSIVELLARVRVAFRHSQVEAQQKDDVKSTFEVDKLLIDFDKRKVIVDDVEVHLTPIEYNILSLLAKHHGKVLTHNFIIKEIWGSVIGNETKSLRVFMATLRRKIEKQPANPRYIITEVGVGYRLNDE